MTSSGHAVRADNARRAQALAPVLAWVRRVIRSHPVIVAAVVLAVGGGVAGAAVALNTSSGFHAAAACPEAGARVYALPSNPAHPSTAPAWPPPGRDDAWAWMPLRHALKVGDRIHLNVNGPLWQVTAIAALPGDCKFMAVSGWANPPGGLVGGRLVLQRVR